MGGRPGTRAGPGRLLPFATLAASCYAIDNGLGRTPP